MVEIKFKEVYRSPGEFMCLQATKGVAEDVHKLSGKYQKDLDEAIVSYARARDEAYKGQRVYIKMGPNRFICRLQRFGTTPKSGFVEDKNVAAIYQKLRNIDWGDPYTGSTYKPVSMDDTAVQLEEIFKELKALRVAEENKTLYEAD